jgi:hypothetical protein
VFELVRHVFLDIGGVDVAVLEPIGIDRWWLWDGEQTRLSEGTLDADLSVHGERSPFSNGRKLVLLHRFHQFDHGFLAQTLVIIVVDLHHGGIGARPQTLDLQEGEVPVIRGLSVFDSQMVLDGLHDFLTAADHAGSGSAHLHKVFPDRGAVEHGVKGGNLVDADGSDMTQLGDLVHCDQWQPSTVLALCQIQQGDHGRLAVVVRIFLEDAVGAFVVFVREIEECRFIVGIAFQVLI